MDELYREERPDFPGNVEKSASVYFDRSDSRFKIWKIQYGSEFMVGGEDPPAPALEITLQGILSLFTWGSIIEV